MLVVLIGVSTWLQFVIVTDLSVQMLTFDVIWHIGEVFSSRMNPGFHCMRQMADSVYGVVWVSGLLMSMLWIEWHMVVVGLCMGRCMLWTMNTGAFYWWHFECTEIPWRDPEAHCWAIHPRHHLMLQHDNARPHVARICTQFLEAENIPVLAWPAYSPDMSPIEHVLGCSGSVYTTACSSSCQYPATSQPLKRIGPTLHSSQSTTWSTLCEGDVLHCVRQMVVTPDTDWFLDPPPPHTVKLHILECPFSVASLRHTCAIIMASDQHLDMPHLWGGRIILAMEKCSLTQI